MTEGHVSGDNPFRTVDDVAAQMMPERLTAKKRKADFLRSPPLTGTVIRELQTLLWRSARLGIALLNSWATYPQNLGKRNTDEAVRRHDLTSTAQGVCAGAYAGHTSGEVPKRQRRNLFTARSP